MGYKIPLHKLLNAIDTKDRHFYDNLTEDEKKGFSAYIALRWSASVNGGGNPLFEEYYLCSANTNANINMFELNAHPKLQWLMISAISPGLGEQRHEFVKSKPITKDNSNFVKKELCLIYPDMKDDDLSVLSKLITKKEIMDHKKGYGEGS